MNRLVRSSLAIVGLVAGLTLVPAAGALTEQQKLLASDASDYAYFGDALAISGDTALVGHGGSALGGDQRTAYVVVRTGGAWPQQAQLFPSKGWPGDFYGGSVAVSGDAAIVGAPLDDVGVGDDCTTKNCEQGSAYVYTRTAGVWTEQAQLISNNGQDYDFFGTSVALDGDTALIGSPGSNVGANYDQGTAYVFVRSGTTWTQQGQLIQSNGAASDRFGWSVALENSTALVGAPYYGFTGSAYVFSRSGTVWTEQQQLLANDAAAGSTFGSAVALGGGKALVGDPEDSGTHTVQGSVYVFGSPPTAVASTAMSAHRSRSAVIVRWRGTDPSVLGYRGSTRA